MKNTFAARQYASIFFGDIASHKTTDNIQIVLEGMEKFCKLANSVKELKLLVYTKKMPRLVKHKIWKNITSLIDIPLTVKNIIETLILHSKLYIINNLLEELTKLHLKSQGIVTVYVTISTNYSSNIINKLDSSIESSLPFKSLRHYKVDKEILGGMILEWQSKMIDLSVRSKMQMIYKFITTN